MRATTIACAISAGFALVSQGCSSDGGGSSKTPPPTYSTQKPPAQAWKAAVGDGGTLLETFDDASWELRKISDHDLYAVSCIDNEIGWAVGAQGFVGHTQDGGWSWPAQASGVTSTLRAVSFAKADDGAQVGLVAGDLGTLLASQDGGQTWTPIKLAGAAMSALRGTAITEGATLLVAVGDGGLLARSSDRGQHFDTSQIAGAADLYDVALDAAGGLALAVDSAGNVWVSRDGAKTFEREYQASAALEGVSLGHSGALASAAGAGAAWLRSIDGAWTSIGYERPLALHATLVGPHEDRVYFAGENGALLETVDAGQSLFAVTSDAHSALRGIEDLEAR
jgi:photosystem II stability/assembly factor-like uncharacterized protein